jgi:hypothetical protein
MTMVAKIIHNGRKLPLQALLAAVCVLLTILIIGKSCSSGSSKPTSALRNRGATPWFSLTPEDTPRIVWFMTFQSAGTPFAMTLVQRATDFSMASNFGDAVTFKGDYSLPIHPRYKEGPYWPGLGGASKLGATPRRLPEKYVLVETICNSTPPENRRSLPEFVDDCRTSYGRTSPDVNQVQRYQYPIYRVAKAIHLIRNPFYQIMEHFENDYKTHLKDSKWREVYPDSREGLLQWCKDADSHVKAAEYIGSATTNRMIQSTTCANQILEYSHWHNRAFEVVNELKLKGMVLRYEDFFDEKLETTLDTIVDFLELSPKLKMPPQRIPKDPENYFRKLEQKGMERLLERLASEQTWEYVKHYFDE